MKWNEGQGGDLSALERGDWTALANGGNADRGMRYAEGGSVSRNSPSPWEAMRDQADQDSGQCARSFCYAEGGFIADDRQMHQDQRDVLTGHQDEMQPTGDHQGTDSRGNQQAMMPVSVAHGGMVPGKKKPVFGVTLVIGMGAPVKKFHPGKYCKMQDPAHDQATGHEEMKRADEQRIAS